MSRDNPDHTTAEKSEQKGETHAFKPVTIQDERELAQLAIPGAEEQRDRSNGQVG